MAGNFTLEGNFKIIKEDNIDDRCKVALIADLDNIHDKYEGLEVFCAEDKNYYKWINSAWDIRVQMHNDTFTINGPVSITDLGTIATHFEKGNLNQVTISLFLQANADVTDNQTTINFSTADWVIPNRAVIVIYDTSSGSALLLNQVGTRIWSLYGMQANHAYQGTFVFSYISG